MHFKKSIILILIAVLTVIGISTLQYCTPKEKQPAKETINPIFTDNEYVGETQCQSCHESEDEDWRLSDHYMSMLPASDSTVLGDFNNATYTADGVTNKFYKKDGKFYIYTEGSDGQYQDFEIKYIFGFKPLQQYLVEFPGGKMQATRASWDTDKKKWFHQYAGQKLHHNDWLHWTKGGQNWNTMCAYCHSTNLQKNYFPDKDSFHTTFNVVNVSCETCHGPGKKHIDYINGSDYKEGKKKVTGSYMVMTDGKDNMAQINNCAPCHARTATISANLKHSNELLDDYIPEIPSTQFFHADGQVNEEDYIYTSFLQSKMSRREVKCTNCHNPHTYKLYYTDNRLCMQCHEKRYDEPSHTFHTTGTEGTLCKSCHMPGKLYMGNDLRHDHSFRVPRPDISVQYNIPNACNNCHTDKSYQWSADAIKKWYGPNRVYHFADDLVPGSQLNGESEKHLTRLIGDTSVPEIAKATAAYYLQYLPTPSSLQTLLQLLKSSDAQVRYRSLRSLTAFPSNQWVNLVGPLLSDKVRAVRIAAADLYADIPAQNIPEPFKNAYESAHKDQMEYMQYQLDFPGGNLMMGDYSRRTNDNVSAEKYYLRALKMDSLLNITRFNLSSLYNALQKNNEALNLLKQAALIEPNNERVYFSLGLLQYEMEDIPGAMKSFEKAVELKTTNPRVYYNYGLLLLNNGKGAQAETVLQKGMALAPNEPDVLYGMTYVYMRNRKLDKAREIGRKLKQLAPNNQTYMQLYQLLGI